MLPFFQFKQFRVFHDKSSMKVGTDAVLLGCLADVKKAQKILDIGCGSGVISLVVAQLSNANIIGIDNHEPSVLQAKENFESSPWHKRLTASLSSLQDFAINNQIKFDGIISNPPFFEDSMKSPNVQRNIARHNDNLKHHELLENAKELLDHKGIFAIILPPTEAKKFNDISQTYGFFLKRKILIQPKNSKRVKRVILELGQTDPGKTRIQNLVIRAENNEYTKEYQKLTKDFYLAF